MRRPFTKMLVVQVVLWTILGVHCLAYAQSSSAPTPIKEEKVPLQAEYGSAKLFPSLRPVTFLKITYFAYRPTLDNKNAEVMIADPSTITPSSTPWIIIRMGKKDPPSGVSIVEKIDRIDLQSIPGNAYVYLKPGTLHEHDKLKVGIHTWSQRDHALRFDIVNIDLLTVGAEPDPYTLTLHPETVTGQSLIDGTTKDVSHLGLTLDIPALVSGNTVNWYLHTEDVFSTSTIDKAAKIDLRLGAERSLFHSWFAPTNIEARYVTNQAFTNSSFVLSSGFKAFVPWGFAHRFTVNPKATGEAEVVHNGILWNTFIKSPIAPELSLSAQYEFRTQQDPMTNASHAAKGTPRIEGVLELNPVYLLAKGTPTQKDITLHLTIKGWWFPSEQAAAGASARKLEANMEVSLLIPLSRFADEKLLSAVRSDGGTKTGIRMTYRTGANEANSFIHSSEWKFGFEVIK